MTAGSVRLAADSGCTSYVAKSLRAGVGALSLNREDRIGSDRIGSDRIESNRIESNVHLLTRGEETNTNRDTTNMDFACVDAHYSH